MTTNEFNELKEKSKKGKVFFVMLNGKNYVCENLNDLPFLNTTLKEYTRELENGYNAKIEALEKRCDKLEAINAELIKALETLNK